MILVAAVLQRCLSVAGEAIGIAELEFVVVVGGEERQCFVLLPLAVGGHAPVALVDGREHHRILAEL